ncbi:MAG: hypothetical protein HY261_01920 [Chloroflexi bacterium]|nr:hypothetical protein [Chloroflexota bacterium]
MTNEQSIFFNEQVDDQITDIVRTAQKQVILVSPFIDLLQHLKDQIKLARRRGVKVVIVGRPEDSSSGGRNCLTPKNKDVPWLLEQGVELRAVERLHSKIYANESGILISSMNLTQESKNSKEFALRITDALVAASARKHVQELLALSNAVTATSTVTPQPQPIATALGFCIRCGDPMRINPTHPLCEGCYEEWAEWGNENYREKVCHQCGVEARVTKAEPLCTRHR